MVDIRSDILIDENIYGKGLYSLYITIILSRFNWYPILMNRWGYKKYIYGTSIQFGIPGVLNYELVL